MDSWNYISKFPFGLKGRASRLGIFFKHLNFKVIFEAKTGDFRELVLIEHTKKVIKQVSKCKKTEYCSAN